MSYLFEILPSLLSGATMTLQVFALVLLFSIPLGILVAFCLQVHWKPLHYIIDVYIWVMRRSQVRPSLGPCSMQPCT